MSNADRIKADLVVAMKSGDALKVSVLRLLLSATGYKQIELQRELTDPDVLAVIASEAKKRREAIASYQAANRMEQAGREQQELDILAAYLPKQLSEVEVRAAIDKLSLPADFGAAMKQVAPLIHGRADMALVARLVKEKLGSD